MDSTLVNKINFSLNLLKQTSFYRKMLDILEENKFKAQIQRLKNMQENGGIEMVIYEIGSMDNSEESCLQFALALLLKNESNLVQDITIYDQNLSATEHKVINHFQCQSYSNTSIKKVERPTLFFISGCKFYLWNNILEANKMPQELNRIVVLGNPLKQWVPVLPRNFGEIKYPTGIMENNKEKIIEFPIWLKKGEHFDLSMAEWWSFHFGGATIDSHQIALHHVYYNLTWHFFQGFVDPVKVPSDDEQIYHLLRCMKKKVQNSNPIFHIDKKIQSSNTIPYIDKQILSTNSTPHIDKKIQSSNPNPHIDKKVQNSNSNISINKQMLSMNPASHLDKHNVLSSNPAHHIDKNRILNIHPIDKKIQNSNPAPYIDKGEVLSSNPTPHIDKQRVLDLNSILSIHKWNPILYIVKQVIGSNPAPNIDKPPCSSSALDLTGPTADEIRIRKSIEASISRLEASDFYKRFRETIKSPKFIQNFERLKLTQKQSTEILENFTLPIVLYGVGKIENSENSRLQFSLAILLKRDFEWVEELAACEPQANPTEIKVMQGFGCNWITNNEKGPRFVRKPTLFFMPGVPLYVHNRLYSANWGSAGLNKMIVLGNSFKTTTSLVPQMTYIFQVLHRDGIVCELPVSGQGSGPPDDCSYAFQFYSWHFFDSPANSWDQEKTSVSTLLH